MGLTMISRPWPWWPSPSGRPHRRAGLPSPRRGAPTARGAGGGGRRGGGARGAPGEGGLGGGRGPGGPRGGVEAPAPPHRAANLFNPNQRRGGKEENPRANTPPRGAPPPRPPADPAGDRL